MDINSSFEDSQQPPQTQALLTASGKRYYGLGNPTKSPDEINLSLSGSHLKFGEPPNYRSRICSTIWILLVILLIVGLVIAYAVFYNYPNPTVASSQGILQGDTIPLYLANKEELPRSISTYWYSSASVEVADDLSIGNSTISVLFYPGDQACIPLPGHNGTSVGEKRNETFEKTLAILKYQYLTIGDNVSVNITVTSTANKVTLYVFDENESYSCFKNSGNASGCGYVKKHPITSHSIFDFSAPLSSYYFVVLESENQVTVDYAYETSIHFYNFTDYSWKTDNVPCDIESKGQGCSFGLNGVRGCLFAYIEGDGLEEVEYVSYVSLSVQVKHNVWNFPGIFSFALAIALLILTIGLLAVKYGCGYLRHCK